MALTETAYAKINLALHVRKRREDGYHELETAFAFVDDGDRLTFAEASQDNFHLTGPFAAQLTNPLGNIVSQALSRLPRQSGLAVTLDKRLPVAAGLGGGSADAGAVFRAVEKMHGLPDDWQERAVRLGADVPACVRSEACVGRGTGSILEPVLNDLTGTPVLLVNPGIPLSTPAVFARWNGQDGGPLPEGRLSRLAREGHNDLETPAIELVPEIAAVLAALQKTGATLVRMSGSGGTCFALFDGHGTMTDAAGLIARDHPHWWQMTGRLR
ncbi:4-(cytidine 5'-diphospho)-2-C-methyl-D-erythritol kinase [Pseudopontixanthobacter vadosimaris]|uniref:4-(cytidine 5'-diphospho)-2-C-methyl-D-erythritol kinase n=1 Tax=Pseudopontixanthobacter vadosimaris TaxID=2726450 RepID=UPI0014727C34|nr:4-(cytidine 5'-diphospho)-2-C-methyl-D-erythritol kinase [Pseudopontixanthobacter vadosimaris]